MSNTYNNLSDIALFVEVVKVMSFRQAAQAIGIPNSTLSRRVSRLEKSIGLRLLNRTTRRIELTEVGQQYFEQCKRIVEEARLAHEQLQAIQSHPSGVIRASMPVDFAQSYLAPILVAFAAQYPDIAFELDVSSRRVDLVREPFDVAVRVGESPDSQLVARLIARLPTFLYASPSYLTQFGSPITPDELTQHQTLCMKKNTSWHLTQIQGNLSAKIQPRGRYVMNNVGMLKKLAILGAGVVLLPEQIAQDAVGLGELQRVLPDWQSAPTPVYAVTETRLLPARVRVFIDFLSDYLRTTEPN